MIKIYLAVILCIVVLFRGLATFSNNSNDQLGSEWFLPIIEDYSEFELRARSLSDEELQVFHRFGAIEIFGDAMAGRAIFYKYSDLLSQNQCIEPIIYALHDINGDGILELLLGLDGADDNIYAIYSLQNGEPASAIQKAHWNRIRLITDVEGRYIIYDSWGRMDHHASHFYTIGTNGELFTLDILYINGVKRCSRTGEMIGYSYAKDIDGEMANISETEYFELMTKYGVPCFVYARYGEHARVVELEWNFAVR